MKQVKLYYYAIWLLYPDNKEWRITRDTLSTVYDKGAFYESEFRAKMQYDNLTLKKDLDKLHKYPDAVHNYYLFTTNPNLDIIPIINSYFDKQIKYIDKARNKIVKTEIIYREE